jgi:hypothetical protein
MAHARRAGGWGQEPGDYQRIGRHGKGDLMGGLTALAIVVVAYTLVASRLDRWGITGPWCSSPPAPSSAPAG